MSPMVKRAGSLQGDGLPSLSRMRTCQNTDWFEARRPATIRDQDRLRRFHHATVPKIRPPFSNETRTACRADVPGGLFLPPHRIAVGGFPTEVWNGDIDANRIA